MLNGTRTTCSYTETTRVVTEIGYGINDDKGREVGIRAVAFEATFTENPAEDGDIRWTMVPGHYFAAYVRTLRGGEKFGAVQSNNYFATAAERDAYIAKRIADGRKQAIKKFA